MTLNALCLSAMLATTAVLTASNGNAVFAAPAAPDNKQELTAPAQSAGQPDVEPGRGELTLEEMLAGDSNFQRRQVGEANHHTQAFCDSSPTHGTSSKSCKLDAAANGVNQCPVNQRPTRINCSLPGTTCSEGGSPGHRCSCSYDCMLN